MTPNEALSSLQGILTVAKHKMTDYIIIGTTLRRSLALACVDEDTREDQHQVAKLLRHGSHGWQHVPWKVRRVRSNK